jgi:hypothetical protein
MQGNYSDGAAHPFRQRFDSSMEYS